MKYYENESRFNGVYCRDNLPNKIKNGAYVTNLDEYSDISTHWVALYVKNNDITYFDSFVVEHIPKEITKFINLPLQNKILWQIFSGYKHMIQSCAKIFVLDLLILCLKVIVWLNTQIFFHLYILKEMMIQF